MSLARNDCFSADLKGRMPDGARGRVGQAKTSLPQTPLSPVLDELIRTFRDRGVSFCLWKSNPLTPALLDGSGDVDLLVAEESCQEAVEALEDHGFVRIENSAWRLQPHVSDWYRADLSQMVLIHVQLYKKLILGDAFSPQVEIPGAGEIFSDADALSVPPVPSIAHSAVLHLCRSALPQRTRIGDGERRRCLRETAQALSERCSDSELQRATGLLPRATARILLNAFSGSRLGPLRRRLLRHHRGTHAGGENLTSKIIAGVARLNRATLRIPIFPRRRLRPSGPVIAVVGSDGSGKSTVVSQVASILRRKIDTISVYFGTGDGPSSWFRKPLIFLQKIRQFRNQHRAFDGLSTPAGEDVPGLAKAVWAITVAMERKAIMRRVTRASRAGWIVISDRYPQVEVSGIHDGPRLGDWLHVGGVRQRIATWELKTYKMLAVQRPDLMLHLDVSIDAARERRPDECGDEISRRIDVAATLQLGGCDRVTIDADQPPEIVVGQALEKIVDKLRS